MVGPGLRGAPAESWAVALWAPGSALVTHPTAQTQPDERPARSPGPMGRHSGEAPRSRALGLGRGAGPRGPAGHPWPQPGLPGPRGPGPSHLPPRAQPGDPARPLVAPAPSPRSPPLVSILFLPLDVLASCPRPVTREDHRPAWRHRGVPACWARRRGSRPGSWSHPPHVSWLWLPQGLRC